MFRSTVLIIIAFTLASCTKVIDIEVKESDTRYVIEGVITDASGDCHVYVSQSSPFNQPSEFTPVTGAQVTVTDNGQPVLLEATGAGVYSTTLINGTPGHTYALSVEVNGVEYTSQCIMPYAVDFDSLYIDKGPFGAFSFVHLWYTDPAGVNNGYRFVQYVNGVKEPTIYWDDDEFTDGDQAFNMLDIPADEKNDPRHIKQGDSVRVQLLTIDEPVLRYWRSLRSGGGSGEGFSAAPANPLSNITGGALGYFSAHTVRERTIVAP